jgi:hypothetical protein
MQLLVRHGALALFLLSANVDAAARADFNWQVETLFSQLKKQRPEVPPETKREMQGKFFVMYPGAGGINRWVFQDNIRTLVEDYGVNPSQILIRDIEKAYAGQRIAPREIPQREAAFLKALAKNAEGGPKPLVLLAHSAHGRELLASVLSVAEEILPGGAIDRVVFIECELGDPPALQALSRRPDFIRVAKTKIFYVGYWKLSGALHVGPGGPYGVGTFLGGLRGDHVDSVMPVNNSAHEPFAYREAFTRVLISQLGY